MYINIALTAPYLGTFCMLCNFSHAGNMFCSTAKNNWVARIPALKFRILIRSLDFSI